MKRRGVWMTEDQDDLISFHECTNCSQKLPQTPCFDTIIELETEMDQRKLNGWVAQENWSYFNGDVKWAETTARIKAQE